MCMCLFVVRLTRLSITDCTVWDGWTFANNVLGRYETKRSWCNLKILSWNFPEDGEENRETPK
jgi:hypothetical protein